MTFVCKWRSVPGLTALLLKALTAAAGAVGAIGAVAVVGGAIMWLRFYEVGIPAYRAVDVLPRHTLIVIGATALIVYFGLGLAAVAFLYALDPQAQKGPSTLIGLSLVTLGATGYLIARYVGDYLSFWGFFALVLLAAFLCIACLRVADVTGNKFAGFGLAVFASVAGFGAATKLAFEAHHPRVQPMAIVRPDDKVGKIGVYVYASSDTIYIARLAAGARPAAIYELERPKGTLIAIGPRMGVENKTIEKAAITLRRQLLSDRVSPAKKT